MNTKRYLVVKSLVFAIPDDFEPGNQVSIDEALRLLLEYRQQASTVTGNNKHGNYVFMATDFPESTNPELPTFTPENLLDFVQDSPDKRFAGMMATVIYDEELGALRNCYNATEMVQFERRKEFVLSGQDGAMKEAAAASASAVQQGLDQAIAGRFVVGPEGDVHEHEPKEENSCDGCNEICQERCPDEPGVEKAMQCGDPA